MLTQALLFLCQLVWRDLVQGGQAFSVGGGPGQ